MRSCSGGGGGGGCPAGGSPRVWEVVVMVVVSARVLRRRRRRRVMGVCIFNFSLFRSRVMGKGISRSWGRGGFILFSWILMGVV